MALKRFIRRDRNWHPPAYTPNYKSTVLRAPRFALLSLEGSESELTGPVFGRDQLGPLDNDLILNYAHALETGGEPIGPRIIMHGHVRDEAGRPVPNALIEVWQANAAGRYRHHGDRYVAAPLDPNFGGVGRTMTDDAGHYAFRTVQPGPYPFPNNGSDWRPAHIHLSIFGEAFAQRLVTQLYFEGDPLIPLDPIANTIRDPRAIEQLTAKLDMGEMQPHDALAWRFDIVLRGRQQTWFENKPEGM